jgi:RHS repeat-associated protein
MGVPVSDPKPSFGLVNTPSAHCERRLSVTRLRLPGRTFFALLITIATVCGLTPVANAAQTGRIGAAVSLPPPQRSSINKLYEQPRASATRGPALTASTAWGPTSGSITGDWYAGSVDQNGNPIDAWDFEADEAGVLTGTAILPGYYALGACEAPVGTQEWQGFVRQPNGEYHGAVLGYYETCSPGPLIYGSALREFTNGSETILELVDPQLSDETGQAIINGDGSVSDPEPYYCFLLSRSEHGPASWPPAYCEDAHPGPLLSEQGGAPNRSEKHSTCSTGHPVNCASGAFWHEFTDAKVPGRGVPLEFTRTYCSTNAEEDGPLGYGWTDSYNMSLSIDGETGAATVREESGSSVNFPSNGEGGFETPARVLATLKADEDGTYTFSRYADHINYVFSAGGQLLREEDRNGDVTSLAYSGGNLASATDPSGRELTFGYSGTHIHAITDPMGRTTTFSYDANGNLKEATDPMGRTWRFTYDGSHRLLTMNDPRGGATTNVYDGKGRVVSQTDAMGRESTWSYEGEAASLEGGTTIFTDARGDQTSYRFRALELLSVTHALGTAAENTTRYTYDPATLGLAAIADPNDYVTRNHFDSHGNLTESTDPMGRTSFYNYGPMDELLEATDPRGTTTTYTYDANGNLLKKETPLTETGEVAKTTYAYGAQPAEVTAVTDPDGQATHFGYDSAGNRTSVTNADGDKTTYSYSADGELVSSVSPRGNEASGNPADHRTEYGYDADGELTTEIDPLGHATEYSYDADGNRTSATNALGQTTHQVYDADNELTEVIRPDGSVLKTLWDAAGNMIAQIDAAGHRTEYSYDAADRLAETTDPNGRTTTYAYEPNGNKSSSTNPEGETTQYLYDGDGELTDIYYSDGTAPVYESYNEDGDRVGMADGSGTNTYAYDSLNRMTGTTDGMGATTRYGYDLTGHLTSLTYPNGQTATRHYDAAGNLASVTDWLGHTTTFTYNADSGLADEQFPGGVSTTLSYDNADRIGSIEDTKGASTQGSFTYARDSLGQITREAAVNGETFVTDFTHDSLNQLTAAGERPYAYDAADNPTTYGAATQQFDPGGELTSATGPGDAPEQSGPEPPVPPQSPEGGTPGGEASAPSNSSPGTSSPGTGSPAAPAAPGSTGRLVRKPFRCRKGFRQKKVHGKRRCVKHKRYSRHRRPGSKRQRHARASVATLGTSTDSPRQNETAEVAEVAPVSSQSSSTEAPATKLAGRSAMGEITRHFAYNARGDRTSEGLPNGDTRFMQYNDADELTQVGSSTFYGYNGDGLRVSKSVNGLATQFVWNETETLPELLEAGETSYLYGPEGQPIEEITASAAAFLHQDQQGSVRMLNDAAGNVVGRYNYTAWGQVTKHAGSASTSLQYDGQYTDQETGFQYLRARYYDPGTGQFLSVDPLSPITRERYEYTENDPLDGLDPYGLFCIFRHSAGGGCRGGGVLHAVNRTIEDNLNAVCLFKDLGLLCLGVPPGLNIPGGPSSNSLADVQLTPEPTPYLPTIAEPCYQPLPYLQPI